jgi:hypothetical protein
MHGGVLKSPLVALSLRITPLSMSPTYNLRVPTYARFSTKSGTKLLLSIERRIGGVN